MKIAFVIANGYAMGGTVRTVYNLARGLSERHEVEIVSLARRRKAPFFKLPDGVRLWPLHDHTTEEPTLGAFGRRRWTRRVGSVVPESELMHLRSSHSYEVHARASMPLVCCSTLSRTLEHFERRKRKTRSKCFIVLNCSWDSQRCTDFTQTFSI